MSVTPATSSATKKPSQQSSVTVRFAGDSGDGMQVTGEQFSNTAALMGNDFATFPDFPAEIRAPAGSIPGVSSFQIQFSNSIIFTPGDTPDVLVAMNPAALKAHYQDLAKGGLILVNEDAFTKSNLRKAEWEANPLKDDTLSGFTVIRATLASLTHNALDEMDITKTEKERCKNFFALGIMFWLYGRTLEHTESWLRKKFTKRPEIAEANVLALRGGFSYADVAETMPAQYTVPVAPIKPGHYRRINGNEAIAIGLITASRLADKDLFYGSYPITPATSILHFLARWKNFGVKTFQAEDEIAALGSAVGAAYGGALAASGTSGPGMCLKMEMLGLAVMAELPIILVNVQRGGPSTGMPTKTEQGDLLQAMYGRNGESPLVVLAPKTSGDCFYMTLEAARIAIRYMTPVIILSDSFLANSAAPWELPDIDALPKIEVQHPEATDEEFRPFSRDSETLARPWALPGTPGLEHRIGGLAKAPETGNVSYAPDHNDQMMRLRAEKIQRVAQDFPPIEIDGPETGELLVIGWGGTYGPLAQGVREMRGKGHAVAHIQLRHLNPFPRDLAEILTKYKKVFVPELNFGQLTLLLRDSFPAIDFVSLAKVQGQPFRVLDIVTGIEEVLA